MLFLASLSASTEKYNSRKRRVVIDVAHKQNLIVLNIKCAKYTRTPI